jgi:hypothetical protein
MLKSWPILSSEHLLLHQRRECRNCVADGSFSIPSVSANDRGRLPPSIEQVIEESRNLVKIKRPIDRCRILPAGSTGIFH